MAWQVQEAKQRFSRLVETAQTKGPQVVTRHGKEVVVVLSIEDYRTLSAPSVEQAWRDFGEATDDVFDELLAEIVASRKDDYDRPVEIDP